MKGSRWEGQRMSEKLGIAGLASNRDASSPWPGRIEIWPTPMGEINV